jgi:hypothetical protein
MAKLFHGANLRHGGGQEKPRLRDGRAMALIKLLHIQSDEWSKTLSGPPTPPNCARIRHQSIISE